MPASLKRPLQPNEILVFLHIPKTAGTSLSDILHHQFPPQTILQVTGIQFPGFQDYQRNAAHTVMTFTDYVAAAEDPDLHLGQFRLIRGHIPYQPPQFQTRQFVYMTMLRHPARRLFSWYQHIRQHKDNPWHDQANTLSFGQFICQDDIRAPMQDNMVSYLLNRVPETQGDLEEACTRLEQMAFVGITEQFEASMNLLHYTFDWTYDSRARRLNTGKVKLNDTDLSTEVRERLHQLTAYDQQLYDYGVELFNQRCQQISCGELAQSPQRTPSIPVPQMDLPRRVYHQLVPLSVRLKMRNVREAILGR
ncbi:MAG: sulfotransferase family protein [Anaerolineae bacterium]|nr:sulfotransferase family protein [Anaerolineae bacterium]